MAAPDPGAAVSAAPPSAGRTGAGVAVQGTGFLLLLLLVGLTPLVVASTASPPPGRAFWVELSVALGFVGLSIMGMQFALVGRFSAVNAPFGLDVVLQYHRAISFTAFAFVLAHPAILVIRRPSMAELLNPVTAHWTARFGLVSIAALVVLLVTSLWRKQLRIRYEVWRVAHGVLAVVVVVTALVHVERVGYYVDGPWKRGTWIVMSAVFLALLVNIRLIKPIRLLRRPWSVASVEPERGGAWTLTLRPDGHDGIRFVPGQFAWLRIDRRPFAAREHPFSISSSAERPGEVSFTIKEAGDFTSTIGSIEPGTRVYLDGPYGVFSYERREGPRFVFLAGGVGIGPILSMLRTLADREDRRPCLLLYGSDRWEDVIAREELDELAGRLEFQVVHVLADPPDWWEGERGFITGEILDRHLGTHPERSRYFLCGPTPMLDTVHPALLERGIPASHVDLERFDLV